MCRTFGQLLEYYRDAVLILVTYLSAYPEDDSGRLCDYEAKDKIGDLKSAVFKTPSRQTIEEVGKLPEGCLPATHLQYRFKQSAVKGISLQTFAIAHKVAEVDEIMRCRVDNKQPEIREVHPEVCFWALNKGGPLKSRKKGKKERKAGRNVSAYLAITWSRLGLMRYFEMLKTGFQKGCGPRRYS